MLKIFSSISFGFIIKFGLIATIAIILFKLSEKEFDLPFTKPMPEKATKAIEDQNGEKCTTYNGEYFCIGSSKIPLRDEEGRKCQHYDGEIFCIGKNK